MVFSFYKGLKLHIATNNGMFLAIVYINSLYLCQVTCQNQTENKSYITRILFNSCQINITKAVSCVIV